MSTANISFLYLHNSKIFHSSPSWVYMVTHLQFNPNWFKGSSDGSWKFCLFHLPLTSSLATGCQLSGTSRSNSSLLLVLARLCILRPRIKAYSILPSCVLRSPSSANLLPFLYINAIFGLALSLQLPQLFATLFQIRSIRVIHLTLYCDILKHIFSKQLLVPTSSKLQCLQFTYVTMVLYKCFYSLTSSTQKFTQRSHTRVML